MIILCTGMFRSGSTWSFNVAKSIICENNPNSTIFSEYNESIKNVINDKLDAFDNIILKCHRVDEFGKSMIRHGCVKVLYTYRNPMEIIVSGMQTFNQKFDDVLGTVKNSLEFLQFQKEYENTCLISYNEIVSDPFMVVKRISKHIDINLDIGKLKKIDSCFERKKIKKLSDSLKKEDNNIIDVGFSYYNAENLFHRNYIRDENAILWEEFLSEEQKRIILDVLKPYVNEDGNYVFGR